jgi:hypothetical protein
LLVPSLFDLSAVPCQSASGVLALGSHFLLVMPGLDPGIHLSSGKLDCRVKPGNDD